MRKYNILAAAIATLLVSPAFANGGGNDNPASTSGPVTATSSSNSNATGVGYGGSSNSSSGVIGSGNSASNSGASATGGKVDNHNSNVGVNTQGQSQTGINKNDNRDTNINGQSQTAKGGNASQGQSQIGVNEQGQKQGQGQLQGQTATGGAAVNAGNAQTTSISTTVEDRLQAPGVSVANVFPTAPCLKGGSVGLSAPGAGISVGKSGKADVGCELRETARSFASIGEEDMAFRLLCASPVVQQYIGTAICLQSRQPKAAPTVDLSKYATKAELDRAFKAGLKK